MNRLAVASRAVTAVGLLALLVLGIPRAPAPGEPLLLDSATPRDTVAGILAREAAPSLTWIDTLPPARGVAALMAAAARHGGGVTLALPAGAGRLRVEAPERPMAGRRGALRLSVRAEPDTAVTVTVRGPGGGVDTLTVATGPDGRGAVSLAVEASREGPASWTARSPDATAAAHAWVGPASPLRVLVWGEAPGNEARYLVRAMESAGMEVQVRQDLGRGLAVTTQEVAIPRTLDDLESYDVVALLGSPSEAADALALRWVRERGGGLLVAGAFDSDSPLTPWAPFGPGADGAVTDLEWAGPAEIVPLPMTEILTRAAGVPEGGLPVVHLGDAPVAHLAHLGRGRLFATGLESWPWVLRAGLASEHQAFWESVVEWLAGGLRGETMLVAEPALPGTRWEGRFEGEAPSEVILEGVSSGSAPTEVLGMRLGSDGSARVAFVPTEPGGHTLRLASDDDSEDPSTPFGVVAVEPGAGLTWTAAARQIGDAGGRIVSTVLPGIEPEAWPGAPSEFVPEDAHTPGRPLVLPWLLFMALGGIAVTGWALRRVQGLR